MKNKVEQAILDLDVLGFFERVTKSKPTPFQSELLLSFLDPSVTKICIVAGRQTGKTLTAAVSVLFLALHGKVSIILCSAQDSFVYLHIRNCFDNAPELRQYIKSEGVYSIVPLKGFETKEGAQVHVRGATEKSLRGIPATIVVCDEAELLSDDILQTALGNLSGKEYKYVLLGTPPRERKGLFFETIKDPTELGFRLFSWNAELCSWHTPEFLATKKKMLKGFYKSEVQGQVLEEAERGIVSAKDVDACTKDVLYREGGSIEVGIDWASGDRCVTVLTVIERIAGARVKVLLTRAFSKDEMTTMFSEITKILLDWRPNKIKVDAFPEQYVIDLRTYYKARKIYAVNFGEYAGGVTLKNIMLGQLIHKIQTHQLSILVTQTELRKQFKGYRRGMQYNDDYVDSLCLANFVDDERFKPATGGCVNIPEFAGQKKGHYTWSNDPKSRIPRIGDAKRRYRGK